MKYTTLTTEQQSAAVAQRIFQLESEHHAHSLNKAQLEARAAALGKDATDEDREEIDRLLANVERSLALLDADHAAVLAQTAPPASTKRKK